MAGDANVGRYVGNGVTIAVDSSGLQKDDDSIVRRRFEMIYRELPEFRLTLPGFGIPARSEIPLGKGSLEINDGIDFDGSGRMLIGCFVKRMKDITDEGKR